MASSLLWPLYSGPNKNSVSPFNMAIQLRQPDLQGLLMTGLTGLHCACISNFYFMEKLVWIFQVKFNVENIHKSNNESFEKLL